MFTISNKQIFLFVFHLFIAPKHFGMLKSSKVAILFCSEITAAAKSLQSCPTLCDPIPGIPQARTLEWVAISFSNA